MKTKVIVFFVFAVTGAIWACGGATVEPVEPEVPDAPDGDADEEPVAEEPVVETADAGEPAAEEPAAEEPAAEEPAAEEPAPEASDFKGKGSKDSIIGNDKGAKGATEFPHWAHQERGTKCGKCHHKGAGRKSCGKGADCHKRREDMAPAIKNVMHKKCKNCHKKKGAGTTCDTCHRAKPAA